MRHLKTILFATILLTSASVQGQNDRTVYYFLDAVVAKEKIYIYSSPIVKTTTSELNAEAALAEFKEKVKSLHGITEFSSSVIRTNDSYDEAKNLMTLYSDRYKKDGYRIVEVNTNKE